MVGESTLLRLHYLRRPVLTSSYKGAELTRTRLLSASLLTVSARKKRHLGTLLRFENVLFI